MKYLVVGPDNCHDITDARHDVVEVEAPNKRQALVEGVREFRRVKADYLNGLDGSPFARLRVICAEGDDQ